LRCRPIATASKLTEQEIDLSLDQARALGEL
jgi:hypothetical protein